MITDDSYEIRGTRDVKEIVCTGVKYGTIVAETISNVAGAINSIPIIGPMMQVVTWCVTAVGHLATGGLKMVNTALGCDSMLLEEIKDKMETQFNELDRKLDQQTLQLSTMSSKMVRKTSGIVEKIRVEMDKGFKRVLYSIENIELKQKVFQINNIADYFLKEKKRLRKLSKTNYIAKLEEENGILNHLKESCTPRGDTLHTAIFDIISNNFAVPKSESDLKAFKALYALFYGTQTYVSIFVFLMRTNSYLADYYYQKGDYVTFNKQIDTVKIVFSDFKSSILGENGDGLLMKLNQILEQVKSTKFINKVRNLKIYKQVAVRSKIINKLKTQIKIMKLPIIGDIPSKAKIKFKNPNINTPLGGWKSGVSVKYAVQYEKNGIYSKLGEWSDSVEIDTRACPHVRVPISSGGNNRLVFRQFHNGKPELVSILNGKKREFRDIDRDLYNAAGMPDKELGLQVAAECIKHGANIRAIFELGRTALHNAAKTGNVRIMKLLIENGLSDVNVKDREGYAPIHVATASGNVGFVSEIIIRGGNVNAITNINQYTPLHLAAQNGYKSLVEELVQQNEIDVNLKDINGFTPLHYAIYGGTEVVSRFYKNQNVDFNIKSKFGLSPAHLAAFNKKIAIIEELKSKPSFNVNAVDVNNMTHLHFAAMIGHVSMVKNMINIEELNLNIATKENKWTALHYAIYFDHRGTAIELIKSQNIDLNVKTTGRVTPLHMAAGLGQLNVVKELLDKGVDIEATLPDGYTALHLAVIKDVLPIFIELKNKGANIEALALNCLSIMELAEIYKSKRVLKYFNSTNESGEIVYAKINRMANNNCMRNISLFQNLEYVTFDVNELELYSNISNLHGNSTSFTPFASSVRLNDSNGTILLLDVLLRKLSKEKYHFATSGAESEFEAQAMALNVTGEFEDVFSPISDLSVGEQIDFTEVYSRVKKALIGGRDNSVTQILCSYADNLVSLKPADKEYLINKIISIKSMIRNYDKKVSDDLVFLLEKTCSV